MPKSVKRLFSLLWVMIFLISVTGGTAILTGCKKSAPTAGAARSGSQVTLTYMTFSANPDHVDDLQAIVDLFEAAHPHINIEYEVVAWDNYFTKLQTLVASGTAPDTFELNYESFVTYASKNVLLNLDPFISRDPDFNTEIFNRRALQAFQYQGLQYSLVESFSNVVLFYNKTLFDQANLAYPDESWNWQKEIEAAQKLTNREKGIWGTYSPLQFWEFYKTIEQNGGKIFNADKTKVLINSQANIETLNHMLDKIRKYQITPSDAQMSGQRSEDLFIAGKLAMMRSGIWMFEAFKEAAFTWDIALEPGNKQKAHHFFANGVAINKKSRQPDAAWQWIKFFTANREAARIRVDSQWELPAINDQELLESYFEKTPPQNKAVVFKALDTLVVPPVISNWNELTDVVGRELDKAKIGEKTAAKALADAQTAIEKILKH